MTYINDRLPPESPQLFGLHPNSEIGYLTSAADSLVGILSMLTNTGAGVAPRVGLGADSGAAAGSSGPVSATGAGTTATAGAGAGFSTRRSSLTERGKRPAAAAPATSAVPSTPRAATTVLLDPKDIIDHFLGRLPPEFPMSELQVGARGKGGAPTHPLANHCR